MTSVIGGPTKGDSNSFDGGEAESTGEDRRLDSDPFSDAPKATNVELADGQRYAGIIPACDNFDKKLVIRYL